MVTRCPRVGSLFGQDRKRVYGGPIATHFEVEVRPLRVARGSGESELLPLVHALTNAHQDARAVRVPRLHAVPVVDYYKLPVGTHATSVSHSTRPRGDDGPSGAASDINARVHRPTSADGVLPPAIARR